mgnify:CR=1 FL=1
MVKKTTAKDGDHVVTMREVAKAAGVSIKTVSNVVNDYEFVSDATRAKVHKAIDELGYVINVSARNLRRGSTGIIALAIPDLQLSYFAQLSSLIITEAKKLGLRVIVEPTLYSREGELDALHGSQTAMVDGLIYSPLELGPDDAAEVEVDYPLVLIGERIFTDKVDHIATENVEGAKRATSYLLQTGCKRVAVVGGGNSGVEAAIDLAGIASSVVLLQRGSELTADKVLQEKLLSLPNVTVKYRASTSKLTGSNKLEKLFYLNRETRETESIDVDGCFVQIGLKPNTEWLDGAVELNAYGEVAVSDRCTTSAPGLFAAGDCTSVPYKQIVIALGEGAKASLSAFDYLIRQGA